MLSRLTTTLIVGLVVFAGRAWTEETERPAIQKVTTDTGAANSTNAANNPANPMITVDLQNYFMPSPRGYPGRIENLGLLRVSVPVNTFGLHQYIRTILPLSITPIVQGGPDTGVGDLTVYDFLLNEVKGATVGVGPLIEAPTARGFDYSPGKWQAGAAGIVLSPHSWGLLGVLPTYAHSFAGNSSGPAGQDLTVQPLVHYNLPHGTYLRSTGVLNFNTYSHVNYIPIGLGAGKVWRRPNGDLINLYFEPQYSVYETGSTAPRWQIYAGVTLKFPMGKQQMEP
jgi:hypothetical protein